MYYGFVTPAFLIMLGLSLYYIVKDKDPVIIPVIMLLTVVVLYLTLMYNLEFARDNLEDILKFSWKRFSFGIIFVMWFLVFALPAPSAFFKSAEKMINWPKGGFKA